MKILIVTQYYWPEFFLINQLSQKLAALGHDITIATGKPNYPDGMIFPGYSTSGLQTEYHEGIKIIRVPLIPRKKGAINLAINYLSFVYSGWKYLPNIFKGDSFDFILVFALSPITAAIPAIWLKKKLNTPLAIWVQDLWPESLSATGYVKNKLFLKWVSWLVRWIYSKSDLILAQSRAFARTISEMAPKDKIIYYPNSITPPILSATECTDTHLLEAKTLLEAQFSIVFAGNMGKAQSIDTIINAAELLKDHPCKFFFIGDGSFKHWAEEEVARRNLTNVIFLGRFDNKLMPALYESANLLLVTLNSSPIFSLTIPSKLQAYLSAGKPIVGSLNGEAADIIKESNAGIACSAENPAELAEAIKTIYLMTDDERDTLGKSGKQYFFDNFDMNKLSVKLIDILTNYKRGA